MTKRAKKQAAVINSNVHTDISQKIRIGETREVWLGLGEGNSKSENLFEEISMGILIELRNFENIFLNTWLVKGLNTNSN